MNKLFLLLFLMLATCNINAQTETVTKVADSTEWAEYEHISAAGDYLQKFRKEMRICHVLTLLGGAIVGVGVIYADSESQPAIITIGCVTIGIGAVIGWAAPRNVGRAGDELRAIYIDKKQKTWKKEHPEKGGEN